MYVSRLLINDMLDRSGIDDSKLLIAFKELGYKILTTIENDKKNDKLQICHIGSVTKKDDYYMCLVDDGDELPIVCFSENKVKQQTFAILAKNKKNIFKLGVIEPIREGELKTEGHLCSLNDLGYIANKLRIEELEKVFEVTDVVNLKEKYHHNDILDLIGLNDTIFEIETNKSFYEIVNDLAFYFRKKPIRKEIDELENYTSNYKISINLNSNKCEVAGQIVINVRQIFEIEETKWELVTYDKLYIDKINLDLDKNIFINISNIIEYETGAKVIFLSDKSTEEELNILYEDYQVLIKNKDKVIYNNEGYLDSKFEPSKNSKDIIALVLFDNTKKINSEFLRNRIGYWMDRYLISKNYTPIRYFDSHPLTLTKFPFNMSEINVNFDKKKNWIRQITKLLRFYDVDVKEFDEHSGEFMITNTNKVITKTRDIIDIIKDKIKLNKI